jgi:hypothetical protein
VKKDAMQILEKDLHWRYYGGKHYESIYTRFFQSHILPVKFNIDKRRAHMSDLINSKQVSRDEALGEMTNPTYPQEMLLEDLEYTIKKFNLTSNSFEEIMLSPVKLFMDYPNNYNFFEKLKRIRKPGLRKTG